MAERGDLELEWRRREGERVRVDTLRVGTEFSCISGDVWKFTRRDGRSDGVFHVERLRDGHMSMFAGCAEVLVR